MYIIQYVLLSDPVRTLCLHMKLCSLVANTTVTMEEHVLAAPASAHATPLVCTVNMLVVSVSMCVAVRSYSTVHWKYCITKKPHIVDSYESICTIVQ